MIGIKAASETFDAYTFLLASCEDRNSLVEISKQIIFDNRLSSNQRMALDSLVRAKQLLLDLAEVKDWRNP